jgi:hypothetical protein
MKTTLADRRSGIGDMHQPGASRKAVDNLGTAMERAS